MREAAPVRAATDPRKHDGALEARRREDSLGPEGFDPLPAGVALGRRHAPGVVGSETRRRKRAGPYRERLRRPRFLSRHRAPRDGALLDGEERRTGLAMQDEDWS